MNTTTKQDKFYLAPMEGVTSYIYRNAQNDFFHNIDKFFTPFIAASQSGKLKTREKQDILPENNSGLYIVPQILTNNADDFIRMSEKLMEYGYEEINLNLGCPAGTVVAKGKGSGFLAETERLDRFLNEVFQAVKCKVSIKTRIGKDAPEEFDELLGIYNQYPLEELIIHPRVQKDYYNNTPNLEVFSKAVESSNCPVCYNGDIFTAMDFRKIRQRYPSVNRFMLGRGLIANPGLVKSIQSDWSVDSATMQTFHSRILDDYMQILSGDVNVLYKMKELWFYMGPMFEDAEKYRKKIRKCSKLSEYNDIVKRIFEEKNIEGNAGFSPNV